MRLDGQRNEKGLLVSGVSLAGDLVHHGDTGTETQTAIGADDTTTTCLVIETED